MRHEQAMDNLSGYVEGSLDAAMQAAVENHIRECAQCYREVATLREMMEVLEATPLAVEPPSMFHDDVMRRVRLAQREAQETPTGFLRRLSWGWRSAGFATAAATLVAIVWVVGPLRTGTPAGFVSGPQAVRTAQPPKVVVSVPAALAPGQDGSVEVQVGSAFAGQISVQATPGLALTGTADAAGGRVIWQGTAGPGGVAPVPVAVRPAEAGQVETLVVRALAVNGAELSRVEAFLPVQTAGQGVQTLRSSGTARDVAATVAATFGAPLVVDSAALDAPGNVVIDAPTAQEAVQAFAAQRGLSVTLAGGAYNLTK